jgi:rubrerythrin
MSIKQDLEKAFAAESEANHQYLSFAAKAEEEGFAQIGRLFRAVAEAEAVHARNHLLVLQAADGTRENLKHALARETHEFDVMYPAMIITAQADGDEKVKQTFQWAKAVERIHLDLYQKALETWEEDPGDFPYWICPSCGHTHEREAPSECPVCGTEGRKFVRIY